MEFETFKTPSSFKHSVELIDSVELIKGAQNRRLTKSPRAVYNNSEFEINEDPDSDFVAAPTLIQEERNANSLSFIKVQKIPTGLRPEAS